MELFQTITLLLSLSALFAYLNHRFIKLPQAIGVMLIAMALSTALVLFGAVNPGVEQYFENSVASLNFPDVVLKVMLGALLFAGALHVDTTMLNEQRLPILLFSTIGVLVSTFLVGGAVFAALNYAVGMEVELIYCLLFGALISPTDPIAVLSILKQANAPKELEVKITGESLFNDGVAVVIFLTLLSIASEGAGEMDAGDITLLFLQEAVGGAVFGLALGYGAYYLLKSIDDYKTEVLITLALVLGTTVAALKLHVSGPLAIVVEGLIIGSLGRQAAMSDTTQLYVDNFWELIDEILNAVLFFLIGAELLVIVFEINYIYTGLLAIVIALVARYLTVGALISLMKLKREFIPNTIKILTWGGIRGGISVALSFMLADYMHRELFVAVTYIVVVFSIVVQGLTIGKVVKRLT